MEIRQIPPQKPVYAPSLHNFFFSPFWIFFLQGGFFIFHSLFLYTIQKRF